METLFALGMPGPWEWGVILLIVLVLFGAKRLPELARSVGQSLKEFRKAKDEFDREVRKSAEDIEIKQPAEKQEHKPS